MPRFPLTNKILDQKCRDKLDKDFQCKLDKIRPTVDTTAPFLVTWKKSNSGRQQDIYRKNQILVEKIKNTINNRIILMPLKKKSLNSEMRRSNFIKIAQENKAILERLNSMKGSYSPQKWDKQWKKRRSMPLKKDLLEEDEKICVCRKKVSVEDRVFYLKIYQKQDGVLLRAAEPGKKTLCLELDMKLVDKIVEKRKFRQLLRMLELDEGNLVLVEPQMSRSYFH